MEAVSFDQSNGYLSRPSDMTDEECGPLSIARVAYPNGMTGVVSCWKLTVEELAEFQRTGRIWLGVLGGTMPPVWLSAKNPFE